MLHLNRDKILSCLRTTFTQGYFRGIKGCQLRYIISKKHSPTAIIVLGGRTEFIEKYGEFFHDLSDLGCTFYSYDHRGQGLSERILADRKKGHVDDFQDYIEDLRIFLEKIVAPQEHRKILIVSHSMGGTIAVMYQQKYPGVLDGIVLSSPMFSISTSPVPHSIAQFVIASQVKLGFGTNYIVGRKYYEASETYEGNTVTSCKERFLLNREFVVKSPELALGGPTNNWVREAFLATAQTFIQTENMDIPVMLLQSGEDKVVSADAQNCFCNKCVDCKMHIVPGALHELLMEKDIFRNQALSLIRSFIGNYS